MSAADVSRVRVRLASPDLAAVRRLAARLAWPLCVLGLLVAALGLRLWGVRQGLPYAYNADENGHFVPKAVGLFGHGLNPHYFVNPPAFTYLLDVVLHLFVGGRTQVGHAMATDPTQVYVVARITSAVLGTIAVGLLYLAGRRLFDRRVGLLAGALLAVAFLPVFYAHLALNDVPALAPICLALVGIAGVARRGRAIDYAIAGVGLGLACATKYTGGIVLVPLVAAALLRGWSGLRGLLVAGVASVVAFLAADPYAVGDWHAFKAGLDHQATAAADGEGKLGLQDTSGIAYYLRTFTWGLGWIPALAALGGAAGLALRRSRLFWVLVPGPVAFLVFMGVQGRFFGRWLLPAFPLVCLLAAAAALLAVDRLAAARPALRPALIALAAVALCGQGVIASVHAGLVLSREDTRAIARSWLVGHVPAGTRVVVEPAVVPNAWAQDVGHPSPLTTSGDRWVKYHGLRDLLRSDGTLGAGPGPVVNIEDYERTLHPGLVDRYEREGFCWVVAGSTQSGRAYTQPRQVPHAIDYYRRLRARSRVVFTVSPLRASADAVPFSFDFSFDFEPLAYYRPGPVMTVYRLDRGGCATGAS